MLRFFIILLTLMLFGQLTLAKEELIQKVPLIFFKSDEFLDNRIAYYVSLKEDTIPEVLFQSEDYQPLSETERLMAFRARFSVQFPNPLPPRELFNSGETFTALNNETRFFKTGAYGFKAERPSFLFNINFKMNASVSEKGDNTALTRSLMENTGLIGEPDLIISQRMYDYNRFISETIFHFALYKVEKERWIVEVIGWTGMKAEVPDYFQRKITEAYAGKMEHFKESLQKVLRGKS
ncbi:MAG: hypothetical protein HOD92_22645 [Deltaproteobacteria bacterium]|jgi:hypothetical protein|nr:hypothetical protein [Deltaproteobacteria bacterium]MBT4526662.1 hypothetical protein [Deltaproteobacteria bacterium]